MYVKFSDDHANFKKGDVVDLAPALVKVLIDLGVAKPSDPPEPKPKAASKKK